MKIDLEAFLNGAMKNASWHEGQGRLPEAFELYVEAALNRLCMALNIPKKDGLLAYYSDQTFYAVAKIETIFPVLSQQIHRGEYRSEQRIGLYKLLPISHAVWLLGKRTLGEDLIRIAKHEVFKEITEKFSFEYIRAFNSLVDKTHYEPKLPAKVTGIDKHWANYLLLIADLTNQRPVTQSLELIDDSFQRANRDRRIDVPGYPVDPTGKHPVQWDFRLEAIRWYAGQAYGVQF